MGCPFSSVSWPLAVMFSASSATLAAAASFFTIFLSTLTFFAAAFFFFASDTIPNCNSQLMRLKADRYARFCAICYALYFIGVDGMTMCTTWPTREALQHPNLLTSMSFLQHCGHHSRDMQTMLHQGAPFQRACASLLRRSCFVTHSLYSLQPVQAAGAKGAHSDSRSSRPQHIQQSAVADPFTANLQSKTEKELLAQVLRQAQQDELAEEAAEEVKGLALLHDSIPSAANASVLYQSYSPSPQ